MKIECNGCNKELPSSEFYTNGFINGKHTKRSKCKQCECGRSKMNHPKRVIRERLKREACLYA